MRQPSSLFTILLGGIVLVYLILPNVIIVPVSFGSSEFVYQFPPKEPTIRWYQAFFDDARWVGSLLRSLRIGVSTAFFSAVLGICAAFALTRGRYTRNTVAKSVVFAPLLVPHIIFAGALYTHFVSLGLLNTEIGLILGHTVLATPIVVITILASMRNLERDLELASMSLGAGYVSTFFNVTLPQLTPGIAVGVGLAFVTSFDELVVAIFVGGVQTTTLPMKMWEGITVESNPILPAASTILVALSIMPWVVIEIIRRAGKQNH